MGVIKRQTIRGSAYSYMGIVVGFFTTALIMPKLMSQEQIGLINILVAVSALYAQFSTLGFTNVTARLFSYFRDKDKNNNGFVFISVAVGMVGFTIALISFFILKPSIVESNLEKSPLLVKYIYYLIPLIFFRMFFLILDTYNKMLFDATTGTFLSDLLYRIGNLFLLIAFFFHWINFTQYVFGFVVILSFPAVYLAGLLIYRKQFNLMPQLGFIQPPLRKEMISLALFGIIGGLSIVAISSIDKILLNEYYNLSTTGVYSISFFFGSIILIPNRALGKISSTIIADAWKDNHMKTIDNIYYKSSINQLFAGLLLFILLVGNLHNIFKLLPPEYSGGEWVIILISFSNLIVASTGVSVQIISTSHKYKIQTYSTGVLMGLTVLFYITFIPLWGMVGAALGSLLSMALASAFRVFYLNWNMKLFPYRLTHLKCLAIGAVAFAFGKIIPVFDFFLIDVIIRSSIISAAFIGLSYLFGISADLNLIADKIFKILRIKK
ncbi:MAG TPA: polysaccharide biosynthesis C-terminal domain-containing protein [Prolixibacteraceae bacterium]|nr:polysaccharide biosynthesis C-terminal domain-containing protein [Prolixibacteraceae bacterium]